MRWVALRRKPSVVPDCAGEVAADAQADGALSGRYLEAWRVVVKAHVLRMNATATHVPSIEARRAERTCSTMASRPTPCVHCAKTVGRLPRIRAESRAITSRSAPT